MKILVADRFDHEALARLKSVATLEVSTAVDAQPSAEQLATCEGLIARSRTKIDASFLAKAPRLKVAITATSGFDHIDFEACAKRGVVVMHTPSANAASAAELTWGLIFALSRKLIDAHRAVKAGEWRREPLVGSEVSGKTLGVVGLGRIGRRVARVAQAFGMKIVAFDPYIDEADFQSVGAERLSLEELMRLADVVTLHVPKSEETEGMITSVLLEAMNRSSLLINASRGSAVSESDLVEALKEKWIAGAALDVFEREPLPRDSRLLQFPNVVLSPHIGATTREAFAAASHEAAEKMIAFARSGTASDRLPPEATWFQQGFTKTLDKQPETPD